MFVFGRHKLVDLHVFLEKKGAEIQIEKQKSRLEELKKEMQQMQTSDKSKFEHFQPKTKVTLNVNNTASIKQRQ